MPSCASPSVFAFNEGLSMFKKQRLQVELASYDNL